jgi:hypothetical protein
MLIFSWFVVSNISNMTKPSKPNISPLEIEIENKLRDAYLFSIVFRDHYLKSRLMLKAIYSESDAAADGQTYQLPKNK